MTNCTFWIVWLKNNFGDASQPYRDIRFFELLDTNNIYGLLQFTLNHKNGVFFYLPENFFQMYNFL